MHIFRYSYDKSQTYLRVVIDWKIKNNLQLQWNMD